jgi:restriction system protein
MQGDQPPPRPPQVPPPGSWNNQTWEAALKVTNLWRQHLQAGFLAASNPLSSSLQFRVASGMALEPEIVKAIPPGQELPFVVRRTILRFGEEIPEGKDKGRIVEMVTREWFDLVADILKDPRAACEVPWDVWEEVLAGSYKQDHWDDVILTPRSGDLGRDVIAADETKRYGVIRVIDQMKRYGPDKKVSAEQVRAMLGILPTDGATKAIITTTADFAPGVWNDPFITPYLPNRLTLINGAELIRKLKEIAERKPD